MLLSNAAFIEYKARFRATGDVDEALYGLLRRVVWVFTRNLAQDLAPDGRWTNEACVEALHGWYIKRLRAGGLAYAFDRASAARPFLNALEQSFQQYLENERPRSETGNLLRRMRGLLRTEDEFRDWIPRRGRRPAWWGLSAWADPKLYGQGDEELVRAASRTGVFTITRFREDSERTDPVLSNRELKRFLIALFSEVHALLTHTDIKIALQRNFNLDPHSAISLDALSEPDEEGRTREPRVQGAEGDATIDEEEVEALARRCLVEIRDRRSAVLRARLGRGKRATLDEIAAELSIARGTVDNDLKYVRALVSSVESETAPAWRILEKIVELLSSDIDER